MIKVLTILLELSLVLFMLGNMLDLGLRLNLKEALQGLKKPGFVILSLIWGFVICPVIALTLTRIIPLQPPYAMGLILLGMAPCAPFLPMLVDKARGDLSYTAAFIVLIMGTTVIYMPLMVPVLIKGLSANPWTIAKPLLLYLMIPFAAGLGIQHLSGGFAKKIHPGVYKVTLIDTVLMLILCVMVYGRGFADALGSYAFGAQILFFSLATGASFLVSYRVPWSQRTVLSLGMATRNIGAALAPLFAIPGVDHRAIVMAAIGVPMQTLTGFVAAMIFGRMAARKQD
jgi:bile acid:Na+ symporter, BASS family